MMIFKIRECNIGDADAIYELNHSEMGYEYPLDKTKDKLSYLLNSKSNKVFVATTENRVVGYVHANDYDSIYLPPFKNIMGIAVMSDCKKKGIGKALLFAVEAWAKETGACGIRLVSGAERTSAHQFYRCCGYDGGKQQINFKKIF
ncbi:MAG: GNAT family N-acetyltransferase [Clostridium sp.]|nr:GNAT family N-acetyltransferase [Clostridium sp.]